MNQPKTTSTLDIALVLILLAIIFAVVWALGVDRFGHVAIGTATGGGVLAILASVEDIVRRRRQ